MGSIKSIAIKLTEVNQCAPETAVLWCCSICTIIVGRIKYGLIY